MKNKQLTIFSDEQRLTFPQAIALSEHGLAQTGGLYPNWLAGFSGGKDSTATLALVDHLISTGRIPKPENLVVNYNDTLMELPPLAIHAENFLKYLSDRGWRVFKTTPKLKYTTKKGAITSGRFFVQLLGIGYPPPNSGFTWCRERMKFNPMREIMRLIESEYGGNILSIDGVRIGESTIRDKAIFASCKKDDGECGSTLLRQVRTGINLSPIAHWRVCHVMDYLVTADLEYGYPTLPVLEVYGADISDGLEDLSARTGCFGCPLVTASDKRKPKADKALERIIKLPQWRYLKPLLGLGIIYWDLHFNYQNRHIWDARSKGNLKRHGRPGCLTLDARKVALENILSIETEVNRRALIEGRPTIQIIRPEELELILQLQTEGAYPENWSEEDPIGGEYLQPLDIESDVMPLFAPTEEVSA